MCYLPKKAFNEQRAKSSKPPFALVVLLTINPLLQMVFYCSVI